MIPFLDLGAAYRELSAEIDAAVSRVLTSGWYIGGPEVADFEKAFATYVEADHCIGTGNGLDALVLALRALDIGPGDGVIVPSTTFIATWLAVSAVGATIQAVEPDPRTHNIDVNRIEAAITPATKAIMPVHLYGQPADLDPIMDLAQAHGLKVIEDAAQAHGARYKGKRIGWRGDVVCWSFYPGKNLGALGDGGCVTMSNAALADRIRRLGNYGSSQKYVHDEKGVNSRLDPLQAAVLAVKLAHLDEWNARRSEIAHRYANGLADCGLHLPHVPQWADPVWHLYVCLTEDREQLHKALLDAGVQTMFHYPIAAHMQNAYQDIGHAPGDFPIAHDLSSKVISLPSGPHMSLDDADIVIDAIRKVLA